VFRRGGIGSLPIELGGQARYPDRPSRLSAQERDDGHPAAPPGVRGRSPSESGAATDVGAINDCGRTYDATGEALVRLVGLMDAAPAGLAHPVDHHVERAAALSAIATTNSKLAVSFVATPGRRIDGDVTSV
jgi:hypothetical protein